MRFLVVCGLSETIASFVPTSRLRSVDLPAFGRPIRETNPDFMSRSGSHFIRLRLRVLGILRGGDVFVDPHFADAAALGVDDLDDETIDLEALADARHTADLRHQEAPDRLESFPRDFHIQPL